ncbi:MAG: endopeptidase La [Zetaproteobacteria bacterium]|nr:endopeptidase La [Zetaproteobacteria bacterium]
MADLKDRSSVEENNKLTCLPLLPLKDIVIFPHMIIPVFISEELCIQAVESATGTDRKIFLSAFKIQGIEDSPGLETHLDPPFDVYDVGTICSVMRTRRLPDGRMKVLVQGLAKARVAALSQTAPYPKVELVSCEDEMSSDAPAQMEAIVRSVRESLEKVVSLGKVLSPDILMILEDVKDPSRLSDMVAANLGLRVEEAQKILSDLDPVERLNKVHACLSREIEVYQMQVRIQSQAKEEIGKMQREHFLREQIRALKSELGDGDPGDEIEELWKALDTVPLPDEAKVEVNRQLRRLERMHQDTSEAVLTRNHIETILNMPWGKASKDNLQLEHVQQVLDEDHYGMDMVKERILEYLAVKKLNPEAKSPILCFVGPPGVGKTSFGRSIARSMGRSFQRISLGGVRDEAEIRGHRKTYVGAYPGRVMHALKQADQSNPVVMLDEIDKLGSDHRGDPASALLEVLDPEQNKNFVDHYLGVAFDLSNVMFIANANTLDTLTPALKDRLEVIEVAGYSEEEKITIAQRYLVPKQITETGLSQECFSLSKAALTEIVRGYTKESGLRSLEKQIASVCRKVARSVAESQERKGQVEHHTRITPHAVTKLLGSKKYGSEFFHSEPVSGVALGLAYTQYGGEVLAIETNLISGSGQLVLTGQLGEVMKESAQAALSHLKAQAENFGLDQQHIKSMDIHIHVPQGAVPKDGPSAGVALMTSMLSAFVGAPPKTGVCMTGEITILGKVLPVGGLKEKVLAAQREGFVHVIVPAANKPQILALPSNAKKKLKFTFVDHYDDAFEFLFVNAPVAAKRDVALVVKDEEERESTHDLAG